MNRPLCLRHALALLALAGPARAGDEVPIARLKGFRPDQSREARFETQREVHSVLEGVGAGERGALYAYGWLYDLDHRKVAWSMRDVDPEEEMGGSLRFRDEVTLPPAHYALYFYAGRASRAPGGVRLKRLFDKRADDPEQWSIALTVQPADRDAFVVSQAEASPDRTSEIRLAPLGDSELRRSRFRITQPADVEVVALGESDLKGKLLADWSWLVRLETREPVWSFEKEESENAGGVSKNRMVRRTLHLEAGNYELVAATDSSHSPQAWNALPPYAPDDWGVVLSAPLGTIALDRLPAERVVARLAGVGNDERASAVFRLERPTAVRIHSFGEWSSGHGVLADYGWIEQAGSGEPVWKMDFEKSIPAGGSGKNRVIDTSVTLPAGTYRAAYVTDDSHAYPDWNSEPPDERRDWGITISTFDPDARFELLDLDLRKASDARPPGLLKR